jgi:hypothetical protein
LQETAARLRDETDCALVLSLPVGPLHLAQWMRGYECWMLDLAGNLEFYEAMMDKITGLWLQISKLCAVHNIQREVPPENVHAMYQEALASGTYPIR